MARVNPSWKIYDIVAHSQKVTCLDLGETGSVLVTGGDDKCVKLWSFDNDSCFMSLDDHNDALKCVKFAHSDNFVYSGDRSGIMKKWDLNVNGNPTTFYGHMKSVKSIDVHPYGNIVVTGSKDSSIRLWDNRNHMKSIKKFTGHMTDVNSVKFSPHGQWVASAGAEGSIFIWDIRMGTQIMDFITNALAVTCIQFHPDEFLLAAGRKDGTVDLYDLEKIKLISTMDRSKQYLSSSVSCLSFNTDGNRLLAGSSNGISVLVWEPDREIDFVASQWNTICDMKALKNLMIYGTYDKNQVQIYQLDVNKLGQQNTPIPAFSYNQSTRKSFSRGNNKSNYSIPKTSKVAEKIDEDPTYNEMGTHIEPLSSLNIDYLDMDASPSEISNKNDNINVEIYYKPPPPPLTNVMQTYESLPLDTNYPSGPRSLQYSHPMDMYPSVESNPDDLGYHSTGMKNDLIYMGTPIDNSDSEDFKVNLAQPTFNNSAPTTSKSIRDHTNGPTNHVTKTKSKFQQNLSTFQMNSSPSSRVNGSGISRLATNKQPQVRRLSKLNSVSTTDLSKLDDSVKPRIPIRQHGNISITDFNSRIGKLKKPISDNNTNKTQFMQVNAKPPVRSKTLLDFRSPSNNNNLINSLKSRSNLPSTHNSSAMHANYALPPSRSVPSSHFEESEINLLSSRHDDVYQRLSNRNMTLQILKNTIRSHDFSTAVKDAMRMNDRSIIVDLLGALLEKSSIWNLDLCQSFLPHIYELLQSDIKFHCTRASDALRVILSTFLPIIRENVDAYAPARSLGVDISREERQNKCYECREWLYRIKMLPENKIMGSTLTQLQNLIIDL